MGTVHRSAHMAPGGVLHSRRYTWQFYKPRDADATYVASVGLETLAVGASLTLIKNYVPNVSLSATVTDAETLAIIALRFTGINHFGEKTGETISVSSTGGSPAVLSTETAWSRVDSIQVISNNGVAGDTLKIGFAGGAGAAGRLKFGIPCKIPSTGMLKKVLQQSLTTIASDMSEVSPGDVTLAPYYTFVVGGTTDALLCHGFLDPDMFEL